MPVRDRLELRGDPAVVVVDEAHHRQVVLGVRIEPGGKDDELRSEFLERRHPVLGDRRAELLRPGAGRKRDVHHVRRRIFGSAIGIERVLERRHHQHTLFAREDVLGAIAVMHVEIHDYHALDAVRVHRVARCDRADAD